MELRPYQNEAKSAVFREWENGCNKTLLVLPTGCGKTIVFAKITEECVRNGQRVLILAHRGELLEQAADKIMKTTGLGCATEKAEESCIGSWYRVVVGSVQTLMREKRLNQFQSDYFDTIIIDEAHHCISDSYRRVLDHFSEAKVLGVTATPDRGDMKNLGQVFESLAYEYTLPKAIKEGYLSPIKALTIPLKLDLTGVGMQAGGFDFIKTDHQNPKWVSNFFYFFESSTNLINKHNTLELANNRRNCFNPLANKVFTVFTDISFSSATSLYFFPSIKICRTTILVFKGKSSMAL